MKKTTITLFSLFLFVFAFADVAFSQTDNGWERVSPLPQEQTLNAVATIPWNGNIITTGEGSTVMISEDEGESWEIMHHPAGITKRFVGWGFEFILPNTIYMFGGYNTILKSTDDGYTWDRVYEGSEEYRDEIVDLDVVDPQHWYMICENYAFQTVVYESLNGGNTWDTIPEPEYEICWGHNIEFGNNQLGFLATSNDVLFKTVDGGASWSEISVGDTIGFDIHGDIKFLNDSTILISGNNYSLNKANIIRSTDFGETWDCVFYKSAIWSNHDLVFYNEMEGFFNTPGPYGYGRTTYLTNDGGVTWNEAEPNGNYMLRSDGYSFTNVGASMAICAGHSGAMHISHDKGASWEPAYTRMINGDVYRLWCLDEDVWMAHTGSGYTLGVAMDHLYKTLDGGMSWECVSYIEDPTTFFDYLSPDTGYMVSRGFNTTLVNRTIDGGETWEEFTIDEDGDELLGIEFYDFEQGVIPKYDEILYTHDAGETWYLATINGNFLSVTEKVAYSTSERIFAIGSGSSNSPVWCSDDAGATWNPVYGFPATAYTSIYFVNEDIGYIAGNNEIWRTIDGGESWQEMNIQENSSCYVFDICFPTEQIGFAVGYGSKILKTTDGGDNWFNIPVEGVSNLTAVHFFDENHGIVMGENGFILRTDNGGATFIEEKPATPQEPHAITLFPNPATDILNITFEEPLQRGELIFYTTAGTEVLRRTHHPNVAGIIMNVQTMDAGAYVVQYVVAGKIIETSKIVIQ